MRAFSWKGYVLCKLVAFSLFSCKNARIFNALKYLIFNEKCYLASKIWWEQYGYGKIGQFIFYLPQLPSTYLKYYFLFCIYIIPNWLLSRPYDLIFVLCTQITPFQTMWPNFIILYTIDSFYLKYYFLFCILYPITPFKKIWPGFCIVSNYSFQDHVT